MEINTIATLTIAMIDYFDRRKPLSMKGINNEEAVRLSMILKDGELNELEEFIRRKRMAFDCFGKTQSEALQYITDTLGIDIAEARDYYKKYIKQ